MITMTHSQSDKLKATFGSLTKIELFLVFQEPNPEDPLNKEAAEVLQTNRRLFEHNVAKSLFNNK